MSRTRTRTETRLLTRSLPKSLVRAQLAGEIAANLGGNEASVRIAQEGFASGSFRRMVVYGVDANGHARDAVRYNVGSDDDGHDHVTLDSNEDRSMIERIDGGYAVGIARTKQRFDRKGLRADVRWHFTPEIDNDPVRKRAEQERLGTVSADPPPTAPGYTLKPVATLTPGRDRNQSLQFYRGKKNPR
jgi:hypothetical protein